MIPILQQWKTQYNFVGSYYVNIGDQPPTAADPSTTDWAKSLPYYQAIEAMGGEIGTHSYTHLINPPTTTFTAHTVGDTPAGSIQVTLDTVPSFYGITVGMVVTGLNIGANTPLPGAAEKAALSPTRTVTAVSGNTVTLSYVPGGYGTLNNGVLGDIPAGTTLTFSVPAENTNFLQTAATLNRSRFDRQSLHLRLRVQSVEADRAAQLGHPIYGAAVPGAAETYATAQNILALLPVCRRNSATPGYTGYVTGGWTGIGSGYPSAFGYMSPTSQGSVYIAPNMTFDFTEIQYQGKTVAQAEADWAAQFNAIAANAAGTPIVVWPIHDYGAAAWNTTDAGSPTTLSPYTTQMYTDFIAQAYNAGYEFVTLEDLASRIAAQQKAHIDYTTVGNTITATVTPDPTAPDLGEMALDVINDGTQVIQNVTNWYAYNAQELFLPTTWRHLHDQSRRHAGRCHAHRRAADAGRPALGHRRRSEPQLLHGRRGPRPRRPRPGPSTPVVTGATISSLVGDQLDLSLTGLGQHDVTILLLAHVSPLSPSRPTRDRAPPISSPTSPLRPFRAP